ncbi:hypothetical protein [Streptomyces sp900116325]|uniref:Ricin B lectin domain-containing protein n=1 Tax=Streptomyces sp. 900116325 TaxID=3154295 RepID=A0ABV2ULR2_9ACTN
MKSLKSLRLAVPMGFAALMLTVAGSISPASAAITYWSYANDYEGNCLASSTTTDNVWTATCDDGLSTRNWQWGSSHTDSHGYQWRQLVSRANGHCLTTDNETQNNAVWTSPCGNAPDQWWSGDNNGLQNENGNHLRSSANGDAVYTSPPYLVEAERYVWWGAHS